MGQCGCLAAEAAKPVLHHPLCTCSKNQRPGWVYMEICNRMLDTMLQHYQRNSTLTASTPAYTACSQFRQRHLGDGICHDGQMLRRLLSGNLNEHRHQLQHAHHALNFLHALQLHKAGAEALPYAGLDMGYLSSMPCFVLFLLLVYLLQLCMQTMEGPWISQASRVCTTA